MNTLDWVILFIFTLYNLWFSWRVSLRQRRYHGIPRFFSFQSLILLVILQYPVWFGDAFAWYQVLSWLLLAGSLLVAFFGFHQFYRLGKPGDQMEETTRLIKSGLYRYIRHPLYLSLILGGFGAMLKDAGWLQVILALVNLFALTLTAKIEEREMIRKFGQAYKAYMKETKLFIPFLL